MKNKSKKILAGIGLGVMSVLSLTGCSMSDEQQEALDKVVSKADQIIELVENQNKELSNAEAVRLYEYAKTRLMVNKDNVWDNLKMIISQDTNEEGCYDTVKGEQHFYKFANGKRVAYGKLDAGEDLVGEIDGWFSEVVPEEESIDPEGSGNVTTITQVTTYSYYASKYTTTIISAIDITEDNIVDCKILENGNYYITASAIISEDNALNPIELPLLLDVELTQDGYIVSHSSNAFMYNSSAEGDKYILTTTVKYEYGTLTDSVVQGYIDAYIAQESVDN